jgi:hypothetical protein
MTAKKTGGESLLTAIVEPGRFVKYVLGRRINKFKDYSNALVCFESSVYNNLKSQYSGIALKVLSGVVWLTDKKFLVCKPDGIGAPATIVFLEELIACGIKNYITLGPRTRKCSAGSLVGIDKQSL